MKKESQNEYSTDFTLNEKNEFMNDHQTGRHIQGMIIVEAFRQTFIAATEKFNLNNISEGKYYVINSMDIEYLNFAFPTPAKINYTIEKSIIALNKSSKLQSKIEMIQNGINQQV